MAVYSRLLLSTGGGIIASSQQALQVQNTGTVLIGLGGTGVHCIRTIKTQVNMRLKPDDEKAVVPTYEHIRFIGVDTTPKSKGGALVENQSEEAKKADTILPLDDSEFFNIGNKKLSEVFRSENALKQRTELGWLEYDKIDLPNLTDAGAGGIRQVGRLMMMDKSQVFMAKLEQEINAAKRGLTNPRVNVHIFSGLSGGTGSGCFLDVCYMVRDIASRIGGITVFGYFFLPDVNLANVPFESVDVRNYIPRNGYAAMQELDYCMSLEKNNGKFEQIYQGNKPIKWATAPVDMCHLICATDKDNNEIPDAYDYAMNVTAEYIMDFLTESDEELGLSEHLANFRAMIGSADSKKTIGSEMGYCVIGASCAIIPLREINTYLVSELFSRFGSSKNNEPTKAEVEKVVCSAFSKQIQSRTEIFEQLKTAIREDTMGGYEPYPNDWKFVRDYTDSEMTSFYANQTAKFVTKVEENAQKLVDKNNPESLISRLHTILTGFIKDVNKGVGYSYHMIAAADKDNAIEIIDGLIKENEEALGQQLEALKYSEENYQNAKYAFESRTKSGFLDNDEKRFGRFQEALLDRETQKLNKESYEKIGNVLRQFKEQINNLATTYYVKLNRVMETLYTTFSDNKSAIAEGKGISKKSSFATPMMSITEIKSSLDQNLEKINVPVLFDLFMSRVIANEDSWYMEDENRIAHLVTDFFIQNAFSEFAHKTITDFLRAKYEYLHGQMSDGQLAQHIFDDWMKLLAEKASPLFYFNSSVWPESKTTKLAFLSFPSSSNPIKDAAAKLKENSDLWKPKKSALTDRIYIMCSACGLPLSAYSNCSEYERMFFSTKQSGRHYYEGKKNPTIEFTDWNKLPSITPNSLIEMDRVPHDLAILVNDARSLYDKAYEYGLLKDSVLYTVDKEWIKGLEEACENCEKKAETVTKAKDIKELETALEELRKFENAQLVKEGFELKTDGDRNQVEFIRSMEEDYFVAAPAAQEKVEKEIKVLDELFAKRKALISTVSQKIEDIRSSGDIMKEFSQAVFTGVISFEGRKVVYHPESGVLVKDIILSKMGDEFKFADIPVFQAFESYKTVDADTRKVIRKMTEDRYNSDDTEALNEVGTRLKDLFTLENIEVWAESAQTFEKCDDIIAFLTDFKKSFDNHCKSYRI